ncbi:MAG: HEAT repeat domain-containing protein, partial [Deltaproteobacteria bacterium]|nr:HEAT repeat domain-containing protein [Deltaproteobacteria bacterium]
MAEPRCGAGKPGQPSPKSLASAPKDVLRASLRDHDACVRKSVVDAIGKSGDAAWLDDLRAACKDADAQVRASAAASLGSVLDRNRPKGPENADARFIQSLIGLLQDRSQQVRRAAAESLQRISGMDLDYSPGYWEAWWED